MKYVNAAVESLRRGGQARQLKPGQAQVQTLRQKPERRWTPWPNRQADKKMLDGLWVGVQCSPYGVLEWVKSFQIKLGRA